MFGIWKLWDSSQWALALILSFNTATHSGLPPDTLDPVSPEPPVTPVMAVSKATLQPTAEPFEWATVWTQTPTNGAGTMGTWYDRNRLDDLAERLAGYAGIAGANARETCIPLKEALEFAYDENATTFMRMSPEQKAFLGLVLAMNATATGQGILTDLLPSDIIMCGYEDNSLWAGLHYPDIRVASVEFRNACRGKDLLPDLAGFYPKEKFGDLLSTYTEEITHAWQANVRGIFWPKDLEKTWAADAKIWDLATEAHAKLISSVMMVEYFVNGGQADVLEKIQDGSQESAMLQAVMNIYLEHGKKTVEKDPSLLLPAFMSFLEDPYSMQRYFAQRAETINDLLQHRRIPFREFAAAFGKIPGMKGNMFSGWKGEKNLDGMMEYIAPDTDMRQWFDEQRAARKAGRQGPPIPVPAQTEEDDETDCTVSPLAQTPPSLSPN